MSKPSWKVAPDWVNWLAQDANGVWYWYESEPRENADWDCFESRSPTFEETCFAGESHGNENWRETLEQRLTPRSLGFFNQVAGVIGENAAEHELQRVIDCGIVRKEWVGAADVGLEHCFIWKDSPQGADFWYEVNEGIVPQQPRATHWDGTTWPIPAFKTRFQEEPALNVTETEKQDTSTITSSVDLMKEILRADTPIEMPKTSIEKMLEIYSIVKRAYADNPNVEPLFILRENGTGDIGYQTLHDEVLLIKFG